MTEVVTAPEERGATELRRISHWIGGQLVAGQSGRTGPVYNPATGMGWTASCTDQEWRT